jgi:hypothetical protein
MSLLIIEKLLELQMEFSHLAFKFSSKDITDQFSNESNNFNKIDKQWDSSLNMANGSKNGLKFDNSK